MKSSIFLVRHAQSQSNVEPVLLQTRTNVGINLTEQGIKQAKETAEFILQALKNIDKPIKVWNSPYERTRETAQYIKNCLKQHNISYTEEESLYIAERQLGLVDDVKNYSKSHPHEYTHYKLHTNEKKDFFVRPPLGESPFDVCMRLDFFLRCVLEAELDHHHIVVTHGACVRGLIMMHQKLPYEEYSNMSNPCNASVHSLNASGYHGEIHRPHLISF